MQQKINKLLKILRERYIEEEKVNCLEGGFASFDKGRDRSDPHFKMCIPSNNENGSLFQYDEKEDTLCVWGRGMGLVYKQGYWAAKTGESGPQYIPVQVYSPEIY